MRGLPDHDRAVSSKVDGPWLFCLFFHQNCVSCLPRYWRRWELFSLFGHVPGVGASGEVCQVHEFGIGGVFAVAALGTHLRRCHQSIVNVEMGLFIEVSARNVSPTSLAKVPLAYHLEHLLDW